MKTFVNTALASLVLTCVTSTASAVDVSAMLKNQNAYGTQDNEQQQQEWLLDAEFNRDLLQGDLTVITRMRWDSDSTLNSSESQSPDSFSNESAAFKTGKEGLVELRELYWQLSTDDVYWRIGKQQVVWGEADGLKLLDKINPQSYREFTLDDFDDSRIPLWMVNAEMNVGEDSTLQALLITDSTAHELANAGSPFAFTSTQLVPQAPSGMAVEIEQAQAPNDGLQDSDLGLRLVSFVSGWDVSLNYLYHYVDTPVVRASLAGNTIKVTQDYERSHLVGGSASTSLGQWIVRSELAYETDQYLRSESAFPGVIKSDVLSYVVGLDWQGWSDQFVSLQLFQSHILENSSQAILDKQDSKLSFMWESKFLNETLSFEVLSLYSINDKDGLNQISLNYNLQANIDVYVGGDHFYGDNNGLFGQFDQADRVIAGVNWGFE
jgi:hypothetical protein